MTGPARALLALAATLLAAGCVRGAAAPSEASSAAGSTTSSVPAPALEVGVEYPRHLHARRRLEGIVVNTGPEPVTVTRLQLQATQFNATPAAPRKTLFPPGRRIDLQTDLGAAKCERPHDAAASVQRTRCDACVAKTDG